MRWSTLFTALIGIALLTTFAIGCEEGGHGLGFEIPEATALLPTANPNAPRGFEHDFILDRSAPGQPMSADWDIPGGHFFTQTGGGSGRGFAVTDDGDAKFWSEFRRLGGVQVVGYPASQRFRWDGFIVQVFQRVIFQWHPDTGAVAFVNVFDRLHEAAKDDWLLQAKSTPPPRAWDEVGKPWDEIVARRLAALDPYPAIKQAYFSAPGDPIQSNGLPTSEVADMGNHYALRAQRVVFQQWKVDVPWAKKGQVTVALGGDIAKEAGILPDPEALRPSLPPGAASAQAGRVQYSVHKDPEKSFKYPTGWRPETVNRYSIAHNYYVSPSGAGAIYYLARYGMGPGFKMEDFVTYFVHAMQGRGNFYAEKQERATIDGLPAILQWYNVTGGNPVKGIAMVVQRNQDIYYISTMAGTDVWDSYEPVLLECLKSFSVPNP